MPIRYFIAIFFFWSNLLHAQGDIDQILTHINSQGIIESSESVQEDDVNWDYEFTELDKSLGFVKAYENLESFNLSMVRDISTLSSEIINKNLVEVFDHHYSETKFHCEVILAPELNSEGEVPKNFTKGPEHFKCDDILAIYETFNDEIDKQLKQKESPGGKVEDLFGITLDGIQITENEVRDADPNYELMLESEQTPNRNSVLEKNHIAESSKNQDISLEVADAICNVQQRIEFNIEKNILQDSIQVLKDSLIDLADTIELSEKQNAFCTLYEYWETEGNYDEIIEFLYLHQPEGDLPCSP